MRIGYVLRDLIGPAVSISRQSIMLVLPARGYGEAVKESISVDDWRRWFLVFGPQ